MGKRIEKSVYRVVIATVGDYERMKRLLESGELPRDRIIEFTRKVSAIDHAMCAVCKGECERARSALIADIAGEKGYGRSTSKAFYPSRSTFTRRKREAIEMISAMLGLI